MRTLLAITSLMIVVYWMIIDWHPEAALALISTCILLIDLLSQSNDKS